MSEQAPAPQPEQQPDSYMQAHPNAIEDPVKAEIMAYASKGQEEAVVQARSEALDAASNIGSSNYRSKENRGAQHEATHQAELAEKARQTADEQAQSAADVYDRVHKL